MPVTRVERGGSSASLRIIAGCSLTVDRNQTAPVCAYESANCPITSTPYMRAVTNVVTTPSTESTPTLMTAKVKPSRYDLRPRGGVGNRIRVCGPGALDV